MRRRPRGRRYPQDAALVLQQRYFRLSLDRGGQGRRRRRRWTAAFAEVRLGRGGRRQGW